MLIVDTNVLVDVLEDDPDWAEWSIGKLRAQAQIHELVINSIIYAELSLRSRLSKHWTPLSTRCVRRSPTFFDPRFSCGAGLSALPACRWSQEQSAIRLLHWRACRGVKVSGAHARRSAYRAYFPRSSSLRPRVRVPFFQQKQVRN